MLTNEGIVIKSNKYQESSKLINVLTNYGLQTYLVRNANNFKSKNYSYALEITKIKYDTSKKNSFEILTSGSVVDNYTNIKNNKEAMFDVIEIFEMINVLSIHVNNNETFYKFVCDILDSINNNYNKYYLIIFKLKLLYLLGINPDFKGCASCNKKELYGFDLEVGKCFCKECFSLKEMTIYADEFEVFRFLYLVKMEFLNNEVLLKLPHYEEHLDKFLTIYYDYYLGFKSKSKKIIKMI